MGARFISEPLYDTSFCRFTLPLIAALDGIPSSTLERFAAQIPEESTYLSRGRDISP
ncbi:hypothetical protein MYXA107069_15500 [Myxococcus xanthus]|nr:hypothetical protein MyxoNM_23595 [Myxococcus xanthus]SDX45188.1 hypothetical protein SAMN05444383_10843 [Myxococcus xanthus]